MTGKLKFQCLQKILETVTTDEGKEEKTLRLARGGKDMSNKKGRFGIHGGQYIPETLMNAVMELEEAYNHYKNDPQFQAELTELLNEYAGRPSRLYYAEKMTKDLAEPKST